MADVNINGKLLNLSCVCPYCDKGMTIETSEDIEFIVGNPTVTCPTCGCKVILPYNEINLILNDQWQDQQGDIINISNFINNNVLGGES